MRRKRALSGEKHPRAKLTKSDILSMRTLMKSPDAPTFKELANARGMSTTALWKAVRGESWRKDCPL